MVSEPGGARSLAEIVTLTCSVCGTEFQAELWLIIDGSERPDLIDRLAADELDTATCSNGHPCKFGFALVLYLPGQELPLLVSTFSDSLSEELHAAGTALLQLLRERLGFWDESWTALHVPRRFLSQVLTEGPEAFLSQVRGREHSAGRPVIAPEFHDLVQTAQLGQKDYMATGDLSALDASVEAWESILHHPAFSEAEGWFRPAAYDDAGCARFRRYLATDRQDDLELAAQHLARAVKLSPPDSPKLYGTLNNLGICLRARYGRDSRPADLNGFIDAFEKSLELAPPNNPNAVEALRALAFGWHERYLVRGDTASLRKAAETLRKAVDHAPPELPELPILLMDLGSALDSLYLQSGDLEAIDAALAAFQKAADLTSERFPHRLKLLNNWGDSLRNRFSGTGDLSDLSASIEMFQRAMDLDPPEILDKVILLINLGSALRDRSFRTKQAEEEDLDRAIRAFRAALELAPEGSREQSLALGNLGTALRDRSKIAEGASGLSDLQESATVTRRALDQTPTLSPDRVLNLFNQGSVLADLYEGTGEMEQLGAAIECLREARALGAQTSDSPRIAFNLAKSLRTRFEKSSAADDLREGVEAFRESCERGLEVGVEGCLYSSMTWTDWALERAGWEETIEAAAYGLRAVEQLLSRQSKRADKEAWLRDARDLHAAAAYALARCSLLQRAVATLEEGRARLLSEALARSSAESGKSPLEMLDGQAPPSLFPEVQAAAAIAPLVYVAVTPVGGLALLVSGDGTVLPVWLDTLTRKALDERLGGGPEVPGELSYLRSYIRWRFDPDSSQEFTENWLASLESTTRWLWDVLMGPIEKALLARGTDQAVLIPQGMLGSMPLHAAWQDLPSSPGGRHVALDSIRISYAPNARAVLAARTRALNSTQEAICAIENPDGSLRFADREVAAVLSHFGPERIRHLQGVEAHKDAVKKALVGASILHFATHGEALPLEPLRSGLLLAEGERLTLGELLETDLTGLRLAVLSACETGVPGIGLPDEVISLPTGFLQAGAAGVLGSLWCVDDESTSLLIVRFYEMWRGGLHPAEALRRAQMWLRELTTDERLSYPAAAVLKKRAAATTSPQPLAPQERPFCHPFHWAAFYFTGT